MKFHWKSLSTLLLFIPFLFRVGYMFGAWQYSPLDSTDYVFWIIAVFMLSIFLFWGYKNCEKLCSKPDFYGLIMLIAGLVVIVFSLAKDINTVYLGGSLLFIAGGCWLLWGWRVLWFLLPVFFIAGLGLPSTSYWISFLLRDVIQNLSGFYIKLVIAAAAFIWFILCLWQPGKLRMRPEPFFFCMGVAVFIFGYVQGSEPAARGGAICLAIKPAGGQWLGEEQMLSPFDDTFQGQNITRRYVHYSKSNICIGTLAIKLRNDLHQIHPAALCLSTGGWKILSNRHVKVKTKAGILSAARIVASKGGRRAMFFTWFTNDIFSTGSFISFRRAWHYNETWYIYQVTTPVLSSDDETAKILMDFINTFAARDSKQVGF
jgi:hypothetical protein